MSSSGYSTPPNQEYALLFTRSRQAELRQIDSSSPVSDNEIRGKTIVTLISAGTELALYTQEEGFPLQPGYAAVFKVEQVGKDVTRFKPGDLAFCMGPHRSFQHVPEQEALLVPKPLSPERAVFARLMSVSMTTLVTTRARPSQKIMITGLGLVGHLAAQLFQHCGYEVIACDPVPDRRRLIQEKGIQQVFATAPLNDPAYARKIGLVLECSGHEQAVIDGCKMVIPKGEVVLIGVPWKRKTEQMAHTLLYEIFHHYITLRSGWEWELPRHALEGQPSIFQNLQQALQWLAQEQVQVDGLYEQRSPHDGAEVYQQLAKQEISRLAVLFDWSRV